MLVRDAWVRIVQSLTPVSLHLRAIWGAKHSWTHASLTDHRNVTGDCLQSETSSNFLTVKDLAILTLLLHLQLLHLTLLLPLHFLPLEAYCSKARFLLEFDVLLHPLLSHLAI